jgi:hypothetical protein
VTPGLQDLVGWHAATSTQTNPITDAAPITPDSSSRNEFGRGRVAYIPELVFDGPLPAFDIYFTIGTNFLKRPKNWKELVDSVDWAARNDLAMRVAGPDFLGANLVEQPDKQRRLVHLVNYNASKTPAIENIEIRCALPQGSSARSVSLYSPASENPVPLQFQMQGTAAVFSVPKMNTYCVAIVNW